MQSRYSLSPIAGNNTAVGTRSTLASTSIETSQRLNPAAPETGPLMLSSEQRSKANPHPCGSKPSI